MSTGRRSLPSLFRSVRRGLKRRFNKKKSIKKIIQEARDKDSPFHPKDRMAYAARQIKQRIPGLRKSRSQLASDSLKRGLKANFSSRPLRSAYEAHKSLIAEPGKTLRAGVKEIKKDKLLAALTVGFAGAEAADVVRAHGPSESTLRKVREKLGPDHEQAYKYYRKRSTRELGGGKHEQLGKSVGGNLSFLAMMAKKKAPFMGHLVGSLAGYHAGGAIGRLFDKPFKKDPRDTMSTERADAYARAVERHIKRKKLS